MTNKQITLLVTFLQSCATILVERGIYFYTEKFYHFDKMHNLLLAMLFGLCYAGAAVVTHRLAIRLGEKRLLMIVLFLHFPMLMMLQAGNVPMLVAGTAFSALLYGAMWPIIESYMVSGDTPDVALKSVGQFNIAWSVSVPMALFAAGSLISMNSWALFIAAGMTTMLSITLTAQLPSQPIHLSENHPERPDAVLVTRYGALLTSARWLMFCSYCLLWILAAILPIAFSRLGVSVSMASPLSSVIDMMRAAMFIVCQFWTGWHGRKSPLVLVMAGMPAGFCLAMCGVNLPLIIAGEIVFGLSAGMCYYASLYYAMVIKNASVEAGGTHEGVIGMGFAVGPMLAAAGYWCGTSWSSEMLGLLAGIGPLVLVCTTKSAMKLLKMQ